MPQSDKGRGGVEAVPALLGRAGVPAESPLDRPLTRTDLLTVLSALADTILTRGYRSEAKDISNLRDLLLKAWSKDR